MKFKNIDFIKDSFVNDNIVLTDNNGRPYDVLTNSDMDSMTVLGKYCKTLFILTLNITLYL